MYSVYNLTFLSKYGKIYVYIKWRIFMIHYFILNPNAGATNSCARITEEVKKIFGDNDNYILYETKSQGDAFRHVKKVCETLEEETIFYACGGDGTVFEVVNGLAGCDKAIFSIKLVPMQNYNLMFPLTQYLL